MVLAMIFKNTQFQDHCSYLPLHKSNRIFGVGILWTVFLVLHVLIQYVLGLLFCQFYLLLQLRILTCLLLLVPKLLVILLKNILLTRSLPVLLLQMLLYRRLWKFRIHLGLFLLLFKLLWKWVLEPLAVSWWVTSVRFPTVLWIVALILFLIFAKLVLIEVLVHGIKNKLFYILSVHFNLLTCQNFNLEWTFSFFCLFLFHLNSNGSTFLVIFLKIILKSFIKWLIGIKPLSILFGLELKTTFMISIGFGSFSIQVHSKSVWRFGRWTFWKMRFPQLLWNFWIPPFLFFSFCL